MGSLKEPSLLLRFKLYGFLKNQRYFESFFLLALLEKGLSFAQFGLLIAVREVGTILLEVPSGALADSVGRRKCLAICFVAYLVSYLVFGLFTSFTLLMLAMLLTSVGDAFRSGTHKALILAWLESQGKESERARVYGLTRSWSKLGSFCSVILGALLVLCGVSYAALFLISACVLLLSLWNLAGYPSSVEPPRRSETLGGGAAAVLHSVWLSMLAALRAVLARGRLRSLTIESMGFDGMFHACKDYLQPLLLVAAVGAWVDVDARGTDQGAALLIGLVYAVLFLASSVASRLGHRVSDRLGGDDRAAGAAWMLVAATYLTILLGSLCNFPLAIILAFVALHLLQNLWRPLLVSRIGAASDTRQAATVLSIESQARRLSTAFLAVTIGFLVDVHRDGASWVWSLWIIGALGLCIALVAGNRLRATSAVEPGTGA